MPTHLPPVDLAVNAFGPSKSSPRLNTDNSSQRSPLQAREKAYHNFSAADDAQTRTTSLSHAATQELQKASAAARGQSGTGKMEMYSAKFYASSVVGGLMACGLTHAAMTPLDLVKCRRQVDATLYKGNFDGWAKMTRADGARGVFVGWSPTLLGYSIQGAFKYGGYEYFKKLYSDVAGADAAEQYKTSLFLAASASAEVFADIGLCPFEAVKVRMQTTMPPFARGTFDGIAKIAAQEGVGGLFKGLNALWGRQIPYTMMKFGTFENVVAQIYARMDKPKAAYSRTVQTAVSFAGGYIAGIACAVISHPADVLVSKLNAGRRAGESFGAATGRIYAEIGFRGLWNGLPVRIMMVGTLTGLQWMIYDYFKIYMGFPSTGGGDAPEKVEQ